MLSEEKLAELERLDADRVSGPWTSDGARVISLEAPTPDDQPYGPEPLNIADCDMDTRIGYDLRAVPTAAFIAALANAFPDLLSELRELRAERKAFSDNMAYDASARLPQGNGETG